MSLATRRTLLRSTVQGMTGWLAAASLRHRLQQVEEENHVLRQTLQAPLRHRLQQVEEDNHVLRQTLQALEHERAFFGQLWPHWDGLYEETADSLAERRWGADELAHRRRRRIHEGHDPDMQKSGIAGSSRPLTGASSECTDALDGGR